MVAALDYPEAIVARPIHKAMLLINSARPEALQIAAQRLRFAYAVEWCSQTRLDKRVDPHEQFSVGFRPMEIIVTSLRAETSFTR